MSEDQRYFAIVKLKHDSAVSRIAKDVPTIVELFQRFSNGEMQLVFRSSDGIHFGLLFRSSRPGQLMRSDFENSDATRGDDDLLIFQAGELASGTEGFTTAWSWLQHH